MPRVLLCERFFGVVKNIVCRCFKRTRPLSCVLQKLATKDPGTVEKKFPALRILDTVMWRLI